MKAFVAFVIFCLALGATVASFATPAAETPTVIDAQSPGAWPTYAAVPGSMIICDVRPGQDLPKQLRAGRVEKV